MAKTVNTKTTQAQKEIAKRRAMELEKKKETQRNKKKKTKVAILIAVSIVVIVAIVLCCVLLTDTKYTYVNLSKSLLDSSNTKATAELLALNGQKVETIGFANACYPTYFNLSASTNTGCPFAGNKYSSEVIPILYRNGANVDTKYAGKKVKVQGTLVIGDSLIYDDGEGYTESSYMVIYIDEIKFAG